MDGPCGEARRKEAVYGTIGRNTSVRLSVS